MTPANDFLPAIHTLGLIHSAHQAGLSTLTQLRVLILLGNGERTITDIAAAVRISWAGASELVNVLEGLGLVDRHKQLFNRRKTWVALKPAGRQVIVARAAKPVEEPA